MKVYTITCHDVYNYGASLQAYALATEKNPHLFYSAKRHLLKTDFFRLYNEKGAQSAFKAIKREAEKMALKNKLRSAIHRALQVFKRRDQ